MVSEAQFLLFDVFFYIFSLPDTFFFLSLYLVPISHRVSHKTIFFKNKVPTCIRIRITKNIHKQTATHLFSAAIERKIRRGPSSRGL